MTAGVAVQHVANTGGTGLTRYVAHGRHLVRTVFAPALGPEPAGDVEAAPQRHANQNATRPYATANSAAVHSPSLSRRHRRPPIAAERPGHHEQVAVATRLDAERFGVASTNMSVRAAIALVRGVTPN